MDTGWERQLCQLGEDSFLIYKFFDICKYFRLILTGSFACTYKIEAKWINFFLPENLSWKPHILNITNKANSTLGFVKRNLHHCPQKVKDQAYKWLVRPRLEYGCTVWDPYRAYQKSWLEQVQRRAARFVTRTYTREEGWITNALKLLNWPTLEKRRQVARLTLMYKCVANQASIDIPCYVHYQSSLKTRASHPLEFIPLQPCCDTYKYNFWPRTIIDWNILTSDYLTSNSWHYSCPRSVYCWSIVFLLVV